MDRIAHSGNVLGSRDVAAMLRIGVDRFYRIRADLHRDGFPAPVTRVGRPRWDRASVEAWMSRHHPLAPRRPPANSPLPAATPGTVQEHRDHLAAVYDPGRGPCA